MRLEPEMRSIGRSPNGGKRRSDVGLRTGWRMVERRDDTTDPGPPPTTEPEPEPAAGGRGTDTSVDDPVVQRLLGGLKAPRFPRAVEVNETDGEFVARYAAGPRDLPARHATPVSQPSVLFGATMEIPIVPARPIAPMEHEAPGTAMPVSSPPRLLATTVSIALPRRRTLPWIVLAGSVLLAALVTFVAILRSVSHGEATAPSTTVQEPTPALTVLRGDSTSTGQPTTTVAPPATSPMPTLTPSAFASPPLSSTRSATSTVDTPPASRPVPVGVPARAPALPTARRSAAPHSTATTAPDVPDLDLLRQ